MEEYRSACQNHWHPARPITSSDVMAGKVLNPVHAEIDALCSIF